MHDRYTWTPTKLGLAQTSPGRDCMEIQAMWFGGVPPNGVYWIKPGAAAAVQVYCRFDYEEGGWTLVLKHWYASGLGATAAAYGVAPNDVTTRTEGAHKVADQLVNDIIGLTSSSAYYLWDQSGFASAYSTGNYEYVIMHGYTQAWDFTVAMGDSTTVPVFKSYQISTGSACCAWFMARLRGRS